MDGTSFQSSWGYMLLDRSWVKYLDAWLSIKYKICEKYSLKKLLNFKGSNLERLG